ncbi:MAG: DUF4230 domain-containing protein [Mogibacterium sp.]|nr:DUF4230 domain-containing protein [Mogibacterium sp.]
MADKDKDKQEKDKQEKAKKEKKKGKGGVIGWILLFLVFTAAGFFMKTNMPSVGHNVVIETQTLKAELVKINELATYQKEYRETVKKEKNGVFSKRYYATFDGVIRAGINMDDVGCEVVTDEESGDVTVKITMPEAVILDHTDSNWNVVYEDGYQLSDIGAERNNAIKEKKKEVEEEFIKEGGLDKAKSKAEQVIEDFIKTAYGEEVVVEFVEESADDSATEE